MAPKPPKKLTQAQQEKKDAEDLKKAVDAMWKACKNDVAKSADEAITKKGFNVNWADEDFGNTALHRAAAFNALAVMRVLFKAGGADLLDVKNKAKRTPLEEAQKLENEEAVSSSVGNPRPTRPPRRSKGARVGCVTQFRSDRLSLAARRAQIALLQAFERGEMGEGIGAADGDEDEDEEGAAKDGGSAAPAADAAKASEAESPKPDGGVAKGEGKGEGKGQQPKKTAEEKEAEKAAKEAEKLLKAVIKEGGKKGVEIEGAADMGGLEFFCTTCETPDGDLALLQMCMDAMNAEPDPEAEDRKGCSGAVGKMIFSAGAKQLAIVGYVPEDKLAKVGIEAWMEAVCEAVGGTVEGAPAKAASPNGGLVASAVVLSDADKGKFALKDKDAAMAAAFAHLRSKGAFPDDDGDDSDDMVFGDDDNLDDYA